MKEQLCRCGNPIKKIKKTISRQVEGRKIVIKNVPVLYCERCKETLLSAKTIKMMDQLIRNQPDKSSHTYPNVELSNSPRSFFRTLDLEEDFFEDLDIPVKKYELFAMLSAIQSKTRSA